MTWPINFYINSFVNNDKVWCIQLNFILKCYSIKKYLQIESKHDIHYYTKPTKYYDIIIIRIRIKIYQSLLRTVDAVRKRFEKLLSDTKMATAKRNSTGRPPVEWLVCYDIVLDILGKDNPKICAISGGIDSSKPVDNSACITDDASTSLDESVDGPSTMPPPSPIGPSAVKVRRPSTLFADSASPLPAMTTSVSTATNEFMQLYRQEHNARMKNLALEKQN